MASNLQPRANKGKKQANSGKTRTAKSTVLPFRPGQSDGSWIKYRPQRAFKADFLYLGREIEQQTGATRIPKEVASNAEARKLIWWNNGIPEEHQRLGCGAGVHLAVQLRLRRLEDSWIPQLAAAPNDARIHGWNWAEQRHRLHPRMFEQLPAKPPRTHRWRRKAECLSLWPQGNGESPLQGSGDRAELVSMHDLVLRGIKHVLN